MMNWAAEKCDDEKSSRSPAVFRRRHLHRRKHTQFPVPLPARAKRRQGAMSYLDPTARSRARAEHSVSSEIGRDMRGNRVVQEGVWSEYVRKDPSHQQQKRSLFDGPPPKRNPSDVGGDELFGHLSCRVLPNPDAQRRGEYQGRRTTDLTPFVDLAAGPQARSRASRMVFREASIDEGAPADAPSPDEPMLASANPSREGERGTSRSLNGDERLARSPRGEPNLLEWPSFHPENTRFHMKSVPLQILA